MNTPLPQTVQPETEESRKKKNRLILVIGILTALALSAVVYLISYFRNDSGWREISVQSGSSMNCGSYFLFQYKLQRQYGGNDFRRVSAAYSEACVKAYEMFDPLQAHPGTHGIFDVNAAPNEIVSVEPELYRAFSLMEEKGSRALYLGPIYAVYTELFLSTNDILAQQFDPYYNEETAAYFAELIPFLSDPAHIRLELLGNDQVRLTLSEEYRLYAAENNITVFLDFYWLTNAFILDYLTEQIAATGYTNGYLISSEGFVSCLDDSAEVYQYAVKTRVGDASIPAAQMSYSGPLKIVSLFDYTTNNNLADYYFPYSPEHFATAYIDPADGYYKSALPALTLYSPTASCAELALAAAQLFIADQIDAAAAQAFSEQGLFSIYCAGTTICSFGNAALSPQNGYSLP
ncbi:MAG: hypothetical protein J5496_00050 [Lachnospiraceae bacterium]|nr:hypothetical protein [Lachnospiraceae bacterium]